MYIGREEGRTNTDAPHASSHPIHPSISPVANTEYLVLAVDGGGTVCVSFSSPDHRLTTNIENKEYGKFQVLQV